jgi:hypothetical protein
MSLHPLLSHARPAFRDANGFESNPSPPRRCPRPRAAMLCRVPHGPDPCSPRALAHGSPRPCLAFRVSGATSPFDRVKPGAAGGLSPRSRALEEAGVAPRPRTLLAGAGGRLRVTHRSGGGRRRRAGCSGADSRRKRPALKRRPRPPPPIGAAAASRNRALACSQPHTRPSAPCSRRHGAGRAGRGRGGRGGRGGVAGGAQVRVRDRPRPSAAGAGARSPPSAPPATPAPPPGPSCRSCRRHFRRPRAS